jgi:Helix-turn-helix domain
MTQPRAQLQKHSADGGRATAIRDTNDAVHIDPHAFGLVKAAYSVGETLDLLSIGRTSLYAAVKRGELKRVKFGKKTLFCSTDIAAFLVRLQTGTCKG